jgi:hypothetical protein
MNGWALCRVPDQEHSAKKFFFLKKNIFKNYSKNTLI